MGCSVKKKEKTQLRLRESDNRDGSASDKNNNPEGKMVFPHRHKVVGNGGELSRG